jgi:hypothetical protein
VARFSRTGIISLLAVISAIPQTSIAAMVECRPHRDAFSVFLSEPPFPSAAFQTKEEVKEFMQRLQFELDQGRDRHWIQAPTVSKVRFVYCKNRSPEMDGRDFNETIVDGLYSDQVLLEIWGRLGIEGESKRTAQMNYLLVPIRFAADQHEGAPESLSRLSYSDEGTNGKADYVKLISNPIDIDAFVAAAYGFKLLREKNWEPAHLNLCRASALMQRVASRTITPRASEEVVALQRFMLASASNAILEARNDSAYSRSGVLMLHDLKRPCGGGT